MKHAIVALLLATTLAGCFQTGAPATVDAPIEYRLEGRTLAADTDQPISGVTMTLMGPDGTFTDVTDVEGRFQFTYQTIGPCTLGADAPEHSSGEVELDCVENRFITLRLHEVVYENPADSKPPAVDKTPLIPGDDEDPLWNLQGTVTLHGEPLHGAHVTLRGDTQATMTTGSLGRFAFTAAPGDYTLDATANCAVPLALDITLTNDTTQNLALPDGDQSPPGAPEGVAATPGPGPVQTTLSWQRPAEHGGAPVERFAIYRDGSLFTTIGNTLAYGDTGADRAGHDYEVAAINGCGVEGPKSASISGIPLPGVLVEAPTSPVSFQISTRVYDVYDPEGNLIGTRDWRTTNDVGNCCETYVASDAAGRLYEYGGSYLFVSEDEGASWSEVSNVLIPLGAEGAIAGAPGGDMVAVNWDPYTGDQLWTHKYVAATDTWYTARTPLHQPFFDREWVSVIEGPFTVGGQTVPYVSFIMSNYVHGDILYLSLDGLHYQIPSQRMMTQLGGQVSFPTELPPDPDRDWTQSMRETTIFGVDDGFGVRDRALLQFCDMAAVGANLQWGCPNWGPLTRPPADGEVLRVDSAGNIHIFTAEVGSSTFDYRMSRDMGKSWELRTARVPNGLVIEEWDVQVNAGLDQAVVVVHASVSTDASTRDTDFVFRFRDFTDGPYLEEIMQVGLGDHIFGGGLTSEYDRFDYTTVTLLATGKVALSFGDSAHQPPGIAVEIG